MLPKRQVEPIAPGFLDRIPVKNLGDVANGRSLEAQAGIVSGVNKRDEDVRVDVSPTGLLLLSDYSDEQEAEADWLGAALLLPRDALLAKRRSGEALSEIAEAFGVSEQLCQWRLRMTGIDRQLKR